MNDQETKVVEALFQQDYGVYQLIDQSGRVALVRQDLIIDNKLGLIDGQIELTASQHEAWFQSKVKSKPETENLFKLNVYRFFENRHYLLAHPALCSTESKEYGAHSFSSIYPCLGAIALSFSRGERVIDCAHCGSKAHLFLAKGTVPSGLSMQTHICENSACQKETTLRMGKMGDVIFYFKQLQDTYSNLFPLTKSFDSKSFKNILAAFPQ